MGTNSSLQWLRSWERRCFAPVDGASLAAFRILFGVVMLGAVVRFVAKGWVHELYILPEVHFTYPGFSWVQPWSETGMYLHFGLLGLSASLLAMGAATRWSALAFFSLFTWIELLDKTTYLNHYYLVSLLAFLLIWLPSERCWSVDAWLRRRRGQQAPQVVPAWAVGLLRFQVGTVYLCAGFAKINADWLLYGQPLRLWMGARSELPVVGVWLAQDWVAVAMSWGGMLFDCSIAFLLLWRRTRWVAFAVLVGFHISVGTLFHIGVFPFLMVIAALIFFPPDWPRRWIAWLRKREEGSGHTWTTPSRAIRRWTLAAVAAWCAIQIALPARATLAGGDPSWDEWGFRFSWRVLLMEKVGVVDFLVTDRQTGRTTVVHPGDRLTPLQVQMMSTQPDMIAQFAGWLAEEARLSGQEVEVRVDSWASLNGRRPQRLIDPEVDLARLPNDWGHRPWVRPFIEGDPP